MECFQITEIVLRWGKIIFSQIWDERLYVKYAEKNHREIHFIKISYLRTCQHFVMLFSSINTHTHTHTHRIFIPKGKNTHIQHISNLPVSKIPYNILWSVNMLLLGNNFLGGRGFQRHSEHRSCYLALQG